jgi:hypothetical protein
VVAMVEVSEKKVARRRCGKELPASHLYGERPCTEPCDHEGDHVIRYEGPGNKTCEYRWSDEG